MDRQILRSLYGKGLAKLIYLELIELARISPTRAKWKNKELALQRGQLIIKISDLEKSLGISKKQIRSNLETLKKMNIIEVKSSHSGLFIAIHDYLMTQAKNGNERGTLEGTLEGTPNEAGKARIPGERELFHSEGGTLEGTLEGTPLLVSKNKGIKNKGIKESVLLPLWKELCPSLPQPRKMGDERLRKERQRLKEEPNINEWKRAFEKLEASDFANGLNDRGYKIDIDFILRPGNLDRVLEGKYDNRKPINTHGGQQIGQGYMQVL